MTSSLRSPGLAAFLIAAVWAGWSDSSSLIKLKCQGNYNSQQLQGYFRKARVTLWLPGTRSVALDSEQRCLVVTVDDKGDGRLAKLALRAVSVPGRVVQVQLTEPES
jgi:hypothetical protein